MKLAREIRLEARRYIYQVLISREAELPEIMCYRPTWEQEIWHDEIAKIAERLRKTIPENSE